MSAYALSEDLLSAFPDEREALRGLAHAVEQLIANLKLGDSGYTWKNELSVSSVLDIQGQWLPLARLRIGLDDECEACDGTGLIEGWPLLPGDDVISSPMTASNQNPSTFHRCGECRGIGRVPVPVPMRPE